MPRNRSEKLPDGVSAELMEYMTAEAMGGSRPTYHNISGAYLHLGYTRRCRIRNDIRIQAGRNVSCAGYALMGEMHATQP